MRSGTIAFTFVFQAALASTYVAVNIRTMVVWFFHFYDFKIFSAINVLDLVFFLHLVNILLRPWTITFISVVQAVFASTNVTVRIRSVVVCFFHFYEFKSSALLIFGFGVFFFSTGNKSKNIISINLTHIKEA